MVSDFKSGCSVAAWHIICVRRALCVLASVCMRSISLFLFHSHTLFRSLCRYSLGFFLLLCFRTRISHERTEYQAANNGTRWQLDNFRCWRFWWASKSTGVEVHGMIFFCCCYSRATPLVSNFVSLYLDFTYLARSGSHFGRFLMLRCFYFIRFWQPVQYTCKRTFTLITFLYISIQRTAKHTSNQNELTHSVLLEHHIQMLFLLLFRFSPSFVAQFHWLGVIFSFFTQRKILCVWYSFSFPPPCGFYSQPLFVLNEFTTMSWSTETFSTLCAVLCVCVCALFLIFKIGHDFIQCNTRPTFIR